VWTGWPSHKEWLQSDTCELDDHHIKNTFFQLVKTRMVKMSVERITVNKKETVVSRSVHWHFAWLRESDWHYSCCELSKRPTKTSDHYKLYLKINVSCVKKKCKVKCDVLWKHQTKYNVSSPHTNTNNLDSTVFNKWVTEWELTHCTLLRALTHRLSEMSNICPSPPFICSLGPSSQFRMSLLSRVHVQTPRYAHGLAVLTSERGYK
jgi:hypothetical protein